MEEFDIVINYARVSTLEQSENTNALKQQLERLESAHPKATHTFFDEQSGNDIDRPQYQACLTLAREASQQRKHVMVRVARLDRWGRNNQEILRSIEEFDSIGVSLFSLDSGKYTAKEASEWLQVNIQGIFAQYFLKQLSSNVKRGNEYRRKQKRPLCNRPPFGYRLKEDKSALEPDPENWAIARQMIDAYLYEGLGMRQLAIMSQGRFNQHTSVKRWLGNPHLAGDIYYTIGGRGKSEPASEKRPKELIYNQHEPLVSRVEQRLIQEKIKENQRRWGKNANYDPPVLSGLVICGHCGRRMALQRYTDRGGYRVARCYRPQCVSYRGVQEILIEEAIQEAIALRAEDVAKASLEPTKKEKPPQLLELEKQKREILQLREKTGLTTLDASIRELDERIDGFLMPVE
ncbi:MAG: recombinase family protein, partial [Cyanobacteria bacterium P01_A01_bin.37]